MPDAALRATHKYSLARNCAFARQKRATSALTHEATVVSKAMPSGNFRRLPRPLRRDYQNVQGALMAHLSKQWTLLILMQLCHGPCASTLYDDASAQ